MNLSKRITASFYAASMMLAVGCVANDDNTSSIKWNTQVAPIPAAKGDAEQHGLAGAYSGVLVDDNNRQTLVMAGGANFSTKPLIESFKDGEPPQKIYHQAIFKLSKNEQGAYRWAQSALNLPLGSAYGASFNTKQGVLILGGEVQRDDGSVFVSKSMQILSLAKDKLSLSPLPDMPVSYAKGAAVQYGNKIYIIGGKQDGVASNAVHIYDNELGHWSKGTPYPGAARTGLVAAVSNNSLLIFSGSGNVDGNTVLLTDGYKLALNNKDAQWQKLGDVALNKQAAIGLLGAVAVAIDEHKTLFVGGYNKQVFDNWLATLKRVSGTAQEQAAKVKYFAQTPEQFNWNKHALVFDALTEQWSSLGETPFLPNCGAAIESLDGNIVLLNGEIMPGVRTPSVKMATIK